MDELQSDHSGQQILRKKSKLPILIIVAVLIGAVTGGIFLFSRNTPSAPPEVPETVTPTPVLSPVPTPTVMKESVKIQVLNGTGTPGQALKVATSLTKAGFASDNIKTANAPDTVAATTISAKDGFGNVADEIKSLLGSDFEDIEIARAPLTSGSEFDIVITTGGEEYVAPKPTPTPTSKTTPAVSPTGTTGTPKPTSGTPTTTTTPVLSSTPTRTPTPTN